MTDTRSAIITGAASGIGRALAEHLLSKGMKLALLDIDESVQTLAGNQPDGAVIGIQVDIRDPDAVCKAVAATMERFGSIDALINNAGIVDNIASVEQMSFEAWEREIGVNLTGAFNLSQAVLPHMRRQEYGRIVHVSSAAARTGLSHQPGYCASKMGLLGLSKSIALEYARFGVTSNCVLPGFTRTEKVDAMPGKLKDMLVAGNPSGRFGELEEVVALIEFLIGKQAGYIVGAEIDVGGGVHLDTVNLGGKPRYFD